MNQRYVLNDLVFFEMFGRNERISFTEYLVELLLHREIGSLKGKIVLKSDKKLKRTKITDKGYTCDILIYIPEENLTINIETYTTFTEESLNKSLSYVNRLFGTQLNRGEKYKNMKRCIQINIVENVEVSLVKKMRFSNYFAHEEKILSKVEEIEFINLDFLDEVGYNNIKEEKLLNLLRYIKAKTKEERIKYAERDEKIMKMNDWLDEFVNDEETSKIFNAWDYHAQVSESIGEKRGEELGLKKGEVLGLKKGEKIGYQKGTEKRNMEIAQNLIAEDMPFPLISRSTGLSIHQIEKLSLKKNKKAA